MRKLRHLFSIVLSVAFAFSVVGCSPAPHNHTDADNNSVCDTCGETLPGGGTGGGESNEPTVSYSWSSSTVTDSTQISDWDGGSLTLSVYYANSGYSGNAVGTNDKVLSEIKRITGISLTKATSADSADLIIGTPQDGTDFTSRGTMKNVIDNLKQYAPNLYARYNNYNSLIFDQTHVSGGKKNTIYGVPFGIYGTNMSEVLGTTNVSIAAGAAYNNVEEQNGYIWVRDDVLKAINPDALQVSDLESIYSQNGAFTSEQLFNASLGSATQSNEDAFVQFVKDVADYIEANPTTMADTYATYLRAGADVDWDIFKLILAGLYGSNDGYNSMYMYWDKSRSKLVATYAVPSKGERNDPTKWTEFESSMYKLNQLYLYGAVDPDCFTDNRESFETKRDAGNYIISFSSERPESNTYSYRKVYFKNGQNTTKYAYMDDAIDSTYCVYITSNVQDAKLPQIMRWLDFQSTDVADKLYAYGVSSANLYNSATKSFSDTSLNAYMITDLYNSANYTNSYNLYNGKTKNNIPVFSFLADGASKYSPAVLASKSADYIEYYFSTYAVLGAPVKNKVLRTIDINNWTDEEDTNYYIESAVSAFTDMSAIYQTLTELLTLENPDAEKEDGLMFKSDKFETLAATINVVGVSVLINTLESKFKDANSDDVSKKYYWIMSTTA